MARSSQVSVRAPQSLTGDVEAVLDQLPFAALLVDSSHRVLYANPAVTHHRAIDPRAVVGRPCFQAVHCTDLPHPGCPFAAAVEAGSSDERELFDERSGRWLRSSIYPTRVETPSGLPVFLHLIHDVSQWKRAEEERDRLHRERQILDELLAIGVEPVSLDEQLGRMLDHLLSVRWLRIEPRGAVFLVNDLAAALELRASRGLELHELQAFSRIPFGRCVCGRGVNGGDACFAGEADVGHECHFPGLSTHGHYCVPIRSCAQQLGVLYVPLEEGHARDAREERFLRAAADLMAGVIRHQELEDRLRRSQKMEALGRLAAGVAHDFNNILAVVSSGAEVVRRKAGADPVLEPVAARLARAGQRAEALVHQLLAFARAEPEKNATVDLDAVVTETADMVRQLLAGRPIALAMDRAGAELRVRVSRVDVERVLLNLVTNACEAIPERGSVQIKVGSASVDARSVDGITPGRYATLSVADSGRGIPPELIDRVFEPFFTTKAPEGGSGLGLAVVYGIVQQAGGKIGVSSRPGTGTTVRIHLPLAGA